MKVCFFGLGSIGQRHLVNLNKICLDRNINLEIHAFRSGNRELSENINSYINKSIFDKESLDNDYDIIFITNPTNLHYETIELMVNKTKHMFIEKPIFDSIDFSLENLKLRENNIYYVACPLRYSNIISYLKENTKNEKIYSVRAICSSYLPNWRNTDYRNTYSAKKSQGGGVSIDLIHEWDYLTYLFGFPIEILNLQGKFSHLEIDSEDLSVYIAKYKDKLIELHLDYFGINSKREIEIYTDKGCIKADLINNKIEFDYQDNIYFENKERDFYQQKELNHFLNIIEGKLENDNSIENAYKVLNMIKECEK